MKNLLAVSALFLAACSPAPERSEGPFEADGQCPSFKPRYPSCRILFGNRGLSTLNSFYETFLGEGAFEISEFNVETFGRDRFRIEAKSNRGPLISRITADGYVRLGQDQENEKLSLTHESSYCNAGRIYELQVGYVGGKELNVQELNYWTEGPEFVFLLWQNGSKTAEVRCR